MRRPHLLLLCSLLLPVGAFAGAGLEARYEFELRVDRKLQTLEGEGKIVVRNASEQRVDSVLVSTYADVYREPDPALNLNERDLRYPRGASRGWMELEISGAAASVEPRGAALREVRLSEPLAPGGEATLEVRFTTHVPKKRGPFGFLDGILTLQGGWGPEVRESPEGPAVLGVYQVKLDMAEDVKGLSSTAVIPTSSRLPTYSISLSRRYKEVRIGRLGHRLFVAKRRKDQMKRLGEALDEALDFYRNRLGRPEAAPLDVAFGYLEQRLAVPGAGYLIVSDQAFRVMTILGVFHVRSLLDATFETLLLRDFPELRARPWVVQFLAYSLRQQYFSEKYGLGRSLGDLIRGPLRLLPAFDELINGAAFPGRQYYLTRFELKAERPEDVFNWNTPFPTGALLAERLGRLVGEETVAELGLEYLKLETPRPELEGFLQTRTSRDLGWFFQQWLGPLQPMGFKIAAIRQVRVESGWRTEVDIARKGTRVDAVEVEAALKGGPPHRGTILLDGPQKTYTFDSAVKPGRITLDPRSDVEEAWRADNVKPPRLKLLLYNSRANLEPKTGQLDAEALFAFLRQYDYKNLMFLDLFTKPLRIGGSIDYAHQWGEPRDPLRYPFTLRFGVGFERTRGDEATGETPESILTLRAGAQHKTASYLGEVDQKNDTLLDLLLEAAPGWPIGRTSFLVGRATAARYQRLSSRLTLAGRLLVGLSFGDLPGNRRFDLGNANALRGFVASEVLTDNVGLLSVELRTDVLRNLDVAFPWGLAFVHRLQIVTFVDSALTSATRNIIGDGSEVLDVGVGIRLHGRWFGIMPSMGKIDVGVPLRGGDEGRGVRIFLGLTQSF
jgi:hypothetical protein